jgi:FAD-dependent urate hydroxylase
MALTAQATRVGGPAATSAGDVPVAVIGAGPHGLSVAAHLARRGLQAQVFGPPMGFWKAMPKAKYLRSNLPATNMIERTGPFSLESYERATGVEIRQPVPLQDFIDYGDWVQRNAVPDVDERIVVELQRDGRRFALTLQDGSTLTAGHVVVACGIGSFEHMPSGFEHLPPGSVSHTAQHRDLKGFAGRRVAIIGSGQSAFECAVLLRECEAEHVELLTRSPAVIWLRGHSVKKALGRLGPVVYAPTDVGPLWYSRLVARPGLFRRLPRAAQDRIAARSIRPACSPVVRDALGELPITTAVTILAAEQRDGALQIRLSDGSARECDHLAFATGYRVDVTRYSFLGEELLGEIRSVGGSPVLRRGLESSSPGLHFVGAPAAWSFGPIMRFVSGSWYAGHAVARAIAAASKTAAPR